MLQNGKYILFKKIWINFIGWRTDLRKIEKRSTENNDNNNAPLNKRQFVSTVQTKIFISHIELSK